MNRVFCLILALTISVIAAVADNTPLSPLSGHNDNVPLNKAPFCGTACTEEAQCVIVGNTHMLVWNSPDPSRIVVVCIHGLGLCARAYKPLAKELSAAGISGYGINVRGFGPDRNDPHRSKLNCEETVNDVCELLRSIRKTYPDYRVILLGESLGGALAVRIAAKNRELIDGVVCSAPAWKILKVERTAVKGVLELVLSPRRPGPASRAVMHQATDDPKLEEHFVTDPAHKLKLSLAETASFLRFISRTDAYAKQITTPVMIVQGLQDRLVSPKAVAEMFRDIPTSNKTLLIDAKGEHLLLEEGGFSPAVLTKLLAWLKAEPVAMSNAPVIEIVDDKDLTQDDKRQLSELRHLAERHS